MASLPTLAVVSGPLGAGKTTLAHRLAQAVGCPAICRDEIKDGLVQASPGFVAAPGDELTRRTLPVFFGVLELLLRAGRRTRTPGLTTRRSGPWAHERFQRVTLNVPSLEVDTTDGYRPGLGEISGFVTG